MLCLDKQGGLRMWDKQDALMALAMIMLIVAIVAYFVADASYEWTKIETREIELLPIGYKNGNPIFHGEDEGTNLMGKSIRYWIYIEGENGGLKQLYFFEDKTSIIRGADKPLLKEYECYRVPNKLYDFLFPQKQILQWEICVP